MPWQNLIPEWLARPAGALSALAALAGAGMMFWSAVSGSYWWAVWGAICFAAGGLLWYLADYAATAPSAVGSRSGGR